MTTDADLAAMAAELRAGVPPPAPPDPSGGFGSLERLEAGDYSPVPPDTGPSLNQIAEEAARLRMLEGTDTHSGAPVPVRAAVGASAPADRLAALRAHYPDAEPLPGTDNFVYTDSAGKRVSYAPIGWRVPTMGDIASVGPEIAEGVGGTLGAIGGTAVAPGVGTAIGAGTGAAGFRGAYNDLMKFFGGAMDTRTTGQRVADEAVTGGVNAVLPGASEWLLGPAIHALMAPGAETLTQQAARALDVAGVTRDLRTTLPAGVAAESPAAQRVEQAVTQMPLTGGLRDAYAGSRAAIEEGLQGTAQRVAAPRPVPDPETFASNVSGIARDIHSNFQTTRAAMDQQIENEIGAGTPIDIAPLVTLRGDLAARLAEAPRTLAPRYQPALDVLDGVIKDANPNGGLLTFGAMRQARTDLGNRVEWPMGIGGDNPTGNAGLKQVYGAMKDSIRDAATAAGPNAERALMDHDSLVANYMADGGPNDTMRALSDPAANANRLPRMAQSTAEADQRSLMHLYSAASPAQKQEITAGMIQKLGTPPNNADFDMGTFARNYQKTTGGARDLVFGPAGTPTRDALDNLVTVQGTLSKSAAYKGFSNTAAVLGVINGLTAMGGHLAAGQPGAAASVGTSIFGSPWVAGKLLTSPAFTRWLAGTWGVNGQQAGQWARHLGQLGTVAGADPAISDLVTRYRAGLPETLPATP